MPEKQQDITRIPPQSVDSEKAVLGAMLQDDEAASRAMEILKEECFYLETHKLIFRGMMKLYSEHKAIDQLTLSDKLVQMHCLEDIGGIPYVADLINRVPSAANIEHYANIVKDKFVLRTIIKASTDMIDSAYSEENEVDQILDEAQSTVFQLKENAGSGDFFASNDIVFDVVAHIEKISQQKGDFIGVPTGFKKFDAMTCGLQKSDLIILAARPSMGKTALALTMLRNMCVDHGVTAGFFSLEMSQEAVGMRLLSMESGIDHQNIRKGNVNPDFWTQITNAASKISEAKMYFDFTANLNVLDIRSRARRLKAKIGELDIIFVDYLQIAKATVRKNDSHQLEVAMISQQLKALAKEMQLPVVALSQLSRAPEQRSGDGKPKLSDLRDSGAIEQDADLVMFIHRPFYVTKDPADEGKGEIIIAKHRNGPTGNIPLTFKDTIVRFFDAPFEQSYDSDNSEQPF